MSSILKYLNIFLMLFHKEIYLKKLLLEFVATIIKRNDVNTFLITTIFILFYIFHKLSVTICTFILPPRFFCSHIINTGQNITTKVIIWGL